MASDRFYLEVCLLEVWVSTRLPPFRVGVWESVENIAVLCGMALGRERKRTSG